MSILNIELIKMDHTEIKEEWNSKMQHINSKDSTEIDVRDIRSNNTKCGEVFFLPKDNFILICGFCEDFYESMLDFGTHFYEKHFKIPVLTSDSPRNLSQDEKNSTEKLLDDETETQCNAMTKNNLLGNDEAIVRIENDKDYEPEDSEESTEEEYETHPPKDQTASESNLYCGICEKQYKSHVTFTRHVRNVHGSNENKQTTLSCRYCDKGFSSEKELKDHKTTHNRFRPYQCPQCPKTFTSTNHRQKHINWHMGYRPFKCPECPSSFGTDCNLRQHMLTHAVAGPLSCEICGKQFIHQSRKDVHMRSHTGEKPFQCELCGRKFIIRSRLTEHTKRHNNTRNHECEICGKKFYTNVMLRHHQVAHSNDRPFECSDCGKTFPRKLSLKMHRKIHSEVKQYSCNICGKEFKQYAGLYAHRKSHGEKKGLPQTNIAVSDKYTMPTHLLIVKNENTSMS